MSSAPGADPDLLRVAILGTDQAPSSPSERFAPPIDEVLEALPGLERERRLLLSAAGYALLRRTARAPETQPLPTQVAADEILHPPSAKLRQLLTQLLEDGSLELLLEAFARMRLASLRLPEELLPRALGVSHAALREALRPVLGERGHWLAMLKPEWAWARDAGTGLAFSEAELEARFLDAAGAERKALFLVARRAAPELSRAWLSTYWRQEKADQRLAWLEVLAGDVTAADEAVLSSMLNDRSAPVRMAAARLCWSIPSSELAIRLRARADALLTLAEPSSGESSLRVALPPATFDPQLEREGVVESPPQGTGRRQWWLAQILAAVPPAHFQTRFRAAPEQLVQAAQEHELKTALLDGFTAAALRHESQAWYAPLWDAAIRTGALSSNSNYRLVTDPIAALSPRLRAEEAAPRMLALIEGGASDRLQHFARPWPNSISLIFLKALTTYQPAFTPLLPRAALALPLELLPDSFPVPEVPENQYAVQAYLRALDQFQATVAIRRTIAQETAP
ncbi:MAG TPA: DUF5691 domain-containing protein [Polyangiaceae bacterium]|nr:DUF5691 domain-containing protein [Polyangiaceae bacterium]